ncbi:mucin-6-like isoform X2 [Ostrinia furnacalis]|uniref:mucin-6-like isoform X2 n=1 Tax=Ostrinia furnacalis TaxID=93504 RepID=UPI00103B3C99|nr:mucin-6-like isoform X2 [Ostrinia furnacalis]
MAEKIQIVLCFLAVATLVGGVAVANESVSICDANEEFLSCGTACAGTCTQPEPVVCGATCSMGCFCKSGFVRDTSNNKCVTVDQCPVEQCFNKNEVYDICNGSCEPSCADPEPICTKLCTGGCICSTGLLRDDNGECVTVDKCPASNSTDPGLLGKYLNAINRILHLNTEATEA